MIEKRTTGAFVMSAIMIIGFYTLILNNNNGSQNSTELSVVEEKPIEAPTEQNPPPKNFVELDQPAQAIPVSKYVDGSFTAQADYFAPSGIDKFEVTVEFKEDKIAKVKTTQIPSSDMSRYFQEDLFEPGIDRVVVGKDIDDATLVFAVNGATLHSIAFNDALESIREEARRTSHNVAVAS